MGEVPIRKIPMGVRALPVGEPKNGAGKIHAEQCGQGDKRQRLPHLDEIDGDD